jgi:hypothetical protein
MPNDVQLFNDEIHFSTKFDDATIVRNVNASFLCNNIRSETMRKSTDCHMILSYSRCKFHVNFQCVLRIRQAFIESESWIHRLIFDFFHLHRCSCTSKISLTIS